MNELYALKDRHGIYICKHTMHNIMFEVHGAKGNVDCQQYTSYHAITLDCIINEGCIWVSSVWIRIVDLLIDLVERFSPVAKIERNYSEIMIN